RRQARRADAPTGAHPGKLKVPRAVDVDSEQGFAKGHGVRGPVLDVGDGGTRVHVVDAHERRPPDVTWACIGGINLAIGTAATEIVRAADLTTEVGHVADEINVVEPLQVPTAVRRITLRIGVNAGPVHDAAIGETVVARAGIVRRAQVRLDHGVAGLE